MEHQLLTPIGESEAVRDIYRKLEKDKEKDNKKKSRSVSFANHEISARIRSSDFAVPGGFRRQFVSQKQPKPQQTKTTFTPVNDWLALWADVRLLSDVQAISTTDHDFVLSPSLRQHVRSAMITNLRNEQLPLLDGGERQHINTQDGGEHVLAGNNRTVFTIIKSFLGTAILFIPRGMYSAGLVAGIGIEICMAVLSLWGMILLIRTRQHLERDGNRVFGYADVAFRVIGPVGKSAVEISILLSQLGFCCVYFAFSNRILRQVLASNFHLQWTDWEAGFAVLCVSAPLVWIRHLKYLAIGNLISDVCIGLSLMYIVGQSVLTIQNDDNEHDWSCRLPSTLTNGTVVNSGGGCFWVNSQSFLMFAGTSVYSFEGIAMVLPIQSSMQNPKDMERLLTWVVLFVATLLVGFGGFCYYVYGVDTKQVVISNMPPESILTDVTKWMYLVVAVVTIPMCMFPAIRLWEKRCFRKQRNSGYKITKSFVRTLVTFACLVVAIFGGKQLDHLVSVIGGLFSAPLALVFPPILHYYAGVEVSTFSKLLDILLAIFGVAMGLLATGVAIVSW
jgi:solute carrier family 36 (proton-coupled amino acid transporter)